VAAGRMTSSNVRRGTSDSTARRPCAPNSRAKESGGIPHTVCRTNPVISRTDQAADPLSSDR